MLKLKSSRVRAQLPRHHRSEAIGATHRTRRQCRTRESSATTRLTTLQAKTP